MSRQELVDVVDIAQTVPSLPENNIKRDNVIFTIERLFNKGIEVVAVEGDEGLGKSTLLRQFCERNTKNTISIFVKAFNTLAYDLSNLRFDVANQVYWIINGKQLGVDEEVDAGKLREYIFQLQRIAKRRNKKYYFIIDGLFDHDGDIEINRKLLLDSLPIGLQHFQFLISGDIEEILGQSKNKIKAKSVQNPSFTYHEAESFLGDIVTKKEDLEELYRASDGIPAYLDTIRRILQNGTDISVLIDELPEHLKDFYEIEWSRIDEGNEDGKLLLAVLAFDKRQMDVDEISVLLSKDNKEIIKFVESLTFIRFDEETKVIEYVSSSFKKFAKSQLDAYKGHANDLVIENLWRKQNDGKSMSMLPSYLMESGRYKDILKVLSTDKLCKYLDVTSSLSSLQRQAGIGIDAAGKLRIDGELLRFVNIKSFLNDLGFSEESKNEIEALIATKKYDEAISIANSAILIEDRLYLLSVVAKCRSKNGENVESALKENIQKLYYQIDVESIDREKSLEIAIELFSTFPDLAISLVEKRL